MFEWKGKDYYTSLDLAKKIHVSQNTINRWRVCGKLKFIKLSERKYLFTEEHIKDFLKGL